jgi:hypothetical protein
MTALRPGRVKTRSVLSVGGVSGDPGRIGRLGAANSAESVREDASWLPEAKNAGYRSLQGPCHARIASINSPTPRILITRFML